MKICYLLLLSLVVHSLYGQNCDAYKYLGDSIKYEACKKAEQTNGHYQFSKKYQQVLDESLEIDPTFHHAYRAKSVAYLKSGDFLTWKALMDKAVKYNPEENLGYRGWCRYQFFRDYAGAIEDFERLYSLTNYDIGFSANGDYHLEIARGVCYKALGNSKKAIEIIENQLLDKNHNVGLYDYLHLGVLYLESGNDNKALLSFQKQEEVNTLADNLYYMALTYKALGEEEQYLLCLQKAKELYVQGRKMYDPYTQPADKIFLEDIENEMQMAAN